MRMRSSSPTRICFAGLARSPFTSTCPPSTSDVARERVLKNRAAHSHLSSRMTCRFAGIVARGHLAWCAVVVATLGCERHGTGASAADSVATTPTDTVVRRVYFIVRRASAMERPTGAVHALRALEPLDSGLAVRVFDQRGKDMSGVRVQWPLANAGEGAAIRALNTKNETVGLSRATVTPGRGAAAHSEDPAVA